MFKEDLGTGLTKKLTRKEQAENNEQNNGEISPTKRRNKPTGRRTGGRPCNEPRGMSLTSMKKTSATKSTNKNTIASSDTESEKSSTSSGAPEPSPKRVSRKKTPPATTSTAAITVPTIRSVRHRQSTLAKALGDPISINTIEETKNEKPIKLNIDSPP